LAAFCSLCSLGCAPPPATPPPASLPASSPAPSSVAAAQAPPPERLDLDYLVLSPRAYLSALAPLLEHRRAQGLAARAWSAEEIYSRHGTGEPAALALHAAVEQAWADSAGQLRFVLLVGDVRRHDETSPERLPAFYLPKLDYNTSPAHRLRHFRHRSLLHPPDSHFHGYPTDYPYALMNVSWRDPPAPEATAIPPLDAVPSVAVGRLPARSVAEVRGFVDKLIGYETGDAASAWPRRLLVYTGPANFGAVADAIIERSAMRLLDERVPYDYDIHVTFAKPDSPYAYRLDRLRDKLVADANRGALFLVYAGHSSPAYFDRVAYRGDWYPLGARAEWERMHIAAGPPLFVSLSCGVGAYDLSRGWRSIAEAAVMNPHGAIASFASSRESHPYPNLLYGEAFIDHFLKERPATIGEGILAIKRGFLERANLMAELLVPDSTAAIKQEHLALYNMLGDPATRLRYPLPLRVALSGAADGAFVPSAAVRVEIEGPLRRGTARVTLETVRRAIREPQVPYARLETMPREQAFEHMAENHAKAVDKVVAAADTALSDGRAELELSAPLEPGRYVVKVLVIGSAAAEASPRQVGAGHALLRVAAASAAP